MKRLKAVCCNCKYFKGDDTSSEEPLCRLHTLGKIIDFLRETTDKKIDNESKIKVINGIPKECPFILEQIILNGKEK